MDYDLIIVGAGASGIISALTARDLGANVLLLEGNDRIGKKILTTGNGRCNISNSYININKYHGNNSEFISSVLEIFKTEDTIKLFSSLGLPLITLEEGKIFPLSLQASSVIDVLRFALEDRSIDIETNCKVKAVLFKNDYFYVTTSKGDVLKCKKVILSTGGKSAPKTGSDGSGLSISKSLNHSIVSTYPALVQLKSDYKNLKSLAGVKFNGTAEIFIQNKCCRKESGEILFTDYGLSGPPILQISREASYALLSKKSVHIVLDLLPNICDANLNEFLENHYALFPYRSANDAFTGIINKKIIPILLKDSGLNSIHASCDSLNWKEKNSILHNIKHWKFNIIGTNSYSDSQVTAGGVDTNEINPLTMESKLLKGLYFAGEVMDVDGDCGGYNLQWAWSTGYIAGKNAAISL